MSAIPASSVSLKTMMDGTLRISFDFEPNQAQDAFRLFAAPGTQVAIAALKAGTYIEQQAQAEKPKGGELARLAGIWSNEPKFWRWIRTVGGPEIDNDMQAAEWIRNICDVQSRAELDHNNEAGDYFHEAIRLPYMDYLRANP
ncbi:hypothetical protein [Polaromonas sp. YR568]|uniref:hypothetical protein n=1 Tax=Polaromonas sp. YR568 TaxID=1855301 RepID=UPI003138277D